MAIGTTLRELAAISRSQRMQLRSASSSALNWTWGDTGPLYSEHSVFSGRGLEDQPAGNPKLAVILHGLLGAGRNLRSITHSLFSEVAQHSGATWTTVLIDLRNHGKSARLAGLDPPHTLQAAAQDVIQTVAANWPGERVDALIGHSLGGKVCLETTRQLSATNASPKQVWVLDAAPGKVDGSNLGVSADVLRVLDTVGGVPLPIPSREWLYAYLEKQGFGKGLQQWLGSNLVMQNKGEYVWSFNLEGATSMFRSYLGSEYWDLLRSPPPHTEMHIVRAEKSDRWDMASIKQLEGAASESVGGRTHVHVLPDAGHWVHVDNPKKLVELMAPSLIAL